MERQNSCPVRILHTAEERGHISRPQRASIVEANSEIDVHPGTARYRSIKFYQGQSKQFLGHEDDRVQVPIWVRKDTLRLSWLQHIDDAIRDINLAAPGLKLYKVNWGLTWKVKIEGTDKSKAYTTGNILDACSADITLGHDFEDKKQTAVHELLHGLGFSHEQCRRDGDLYLTNTVTPSEASNFGDYAVDREVEAMTRFDPFSVMLYPEDEKLLRKSRNDIVWQLKPDRTINRELSELDKLRLNLLYRPCQSATYSPELSDDTGLYYCGRRVMDRHNIPADNTTDGRCGPDNWANCPACRTLKNPTVDELIRSGKWQGWSGLFYCGRYFGESEPGHDGYCGPDNGTPCPDCFRLLYRNRPHQSDDDDCVIL